MKTFGATARNIFIPLDLMQMQERKRQGDFWPTAKYQCQCATCIHPGKIRIDGKWLPINGGKSKHMVTIKFP